VPAETVAVVIGMYCLKTASPPYRAKRGTWRDRGRALEWFGFDSNS